ncbi:hypothetical protein [Methylobacterium thuringiense]|nr:hypothetical protein [Methylobacterium thuringiense]
MPRRIPGAIGKSEEWLAIDDAAAAIGTTKETANFRRAWQALVSAAARGEPTTVHDVTVRMAACRISGFDRWCAHSEDIHLLAPYTQKRERRWPTRPEGWLTLEEASERAGRDVDPDVLADAWRALTKGTAYAGFARIAGLDIQLRRGHVHANERWFIHPDDAERLVGAIRGRLPHLRKGFLPPDAIAASVERDARPLARTLMASLGDAKALTGQAALEGQTFEIRNFLVEGKPAPCLAEGELARFMDTLTRMHDEATADEVSRWGP